MPFLRFRHNGSLPQPIDPTDKSALEADKAPIFLLPGIFGNAAELASLANQLDIQSGGLRPIYIWMDPRIKDRTSEIKFNSLENESKLIADEMIQQMIPYLSPEPKPYLVVGYSYGGPLAVSACQQLKKKGIESCIFLVDGPSPESSQDYFNAGTKSVIEDLIAIVKYAAELVGLFLPSDASISSSKIQEVWPLDDCIDKIVDEILKILQAIRDSKKANESEGSEDEELSEDEEDNFDEQVDRFKKLVNLAKTKLFNLLSYRASPDSPPLNNINVLITAKTAKKYKDDHKGRWDKYVESNQSLYLIDNQEFQSAEHQELVNKKYSEKLAEKITARIRTQFTRPNLMSEKLRQVAKDLKAFMLQQGLGEEPIIDLLTDTADKIISPQSMSPLSCSPQSTNPLLNIPKNSFLSIKGKLDVPGNESGSDSDLEEKNCFSSKNIGASLEDEGNSSECEEDSIKANSTVERQDRNYGRMFSIPKIQITPTESPPVRINTRNTPRGK